MGKPEALLVATRSIDSPTARDGMSPSVISASPRPTGMVVVTGSAGAQSASPAWLAVSTQVPAPVATSVVPSRAHGPATASSTGDPDAALARTGRLSPTTTAAIGSMAMR